MISLTFPDGSARDFKPGITGRDVAESIAKSLAKKAVAGESRTAGRDCRACLFAEAGEKASSPARIGSRS